MCGHAPVAGTDEITEVWSSERWESGQSADRPVNSMVRRTQGAVVALGKIKRPEDFKHLLWRQHPDSASWDGCRPELIATDGRVVRRLSSQHQHIAFQAFEDAESAREIASKIEASVSKGVALLGYSMFAKNEAVAILHTASGLEPGWVAYPHKKSSSSTVPTLPLRVAEMPKLRLVGGADTSWSEGKLHLECALEQRGQTFAESEHAFNIVDHIKEWEVWGRTGRGDDAKKLRLVNKHAEPKIRRVGDRRLDGTFPIDEVIWREFEDAPGFRLWFLVQFDRELFCLPDDWLQFSLHVEI
jgi:hypothetical protein